MAGDVFFHCVVDLGVFGLIVIPVLFFVGVFVVADEVGEGVPNGADGWGILGSGTVWSVVNEGGMGCCFGKGQGGDVVLRWRQGSFDARHAPGVCLWEAAVDWGPV